MENKTAPLTHASNVTATGVGRVLGLARREGAKDRLLHGPASRHATVLPSMGGAHILRPACMGQRWIRQTNYNFTILERQR